MSSVYTLYSSLYINASRKEAWDFLSSPSNLLTLTPPRFGMRVMPESSEGFYEGAVYAYSLMPIPGFRRLWLSEISHIQAPYQFVDVQIHGPYAYWHHTHQVREWGEHCSQLVDKIVYKLPMGPLGDLLHQPLVKPGLKEAFAFRTQKLLELFGGCQGYEPEFRMSRLQYTHH